MLRFMTGKKKRVLPARPAAADAEAEPEVPPQAMEVETVLGPKAAEPAAAAKAGASEESVLGPKTETEPAALQMEAESELKPRADTDARPVLKDRARKEPVRRGKAPMSAGSQLIPMSEGSQPVPTLPASNQPTSADQPSLALAGINPRKSAIRPLTSGSNLPQLRPVGGRSLPPAIGVGSPERAGAINAGAQAHQLKQPPPLKQSLPLGSRAAAAAASTASLHGRLSSLDDRLATALGVGDVLLLRASWVCSRPAGTKLARRQVLEQTTQRDRPFLEPSDAVALLRRGQRQIGVLSHGWLSHGDCDPVGARLAVVQRALRQNPHIDALFWDQASLSQKPRTPEEDAGFGRALTVMGDLYASAVGTTVLQYKEIPPRPREYDGLLCLIGVRVSPADESVEEHDGRRPATTLGDFRSRAKEQISCTYAQFGAIDEVHLPEALGVDTSSPCDESVIVRFREHAAARAADEAGVKLHGELTCVACALAYNERSYDGRSGEEGRADDTGRGWCCFEDAVSYELVARLSVYPKLRQVLDALPSKMLQLRGDVAATPILLESDAKLEQRVDHVVARIVGARFTGKGDAEAVPALYKNYVMQLAIALEETLKVAKTTADDDDDVQVLAPLPQVHAPHAKPTRFAPCQLLLLLPTQDAERRAGGEGDEASLRLGAVDAAGKKVVLATGEYLRVSKLAGDAYSQIALPFPVRGAQPPANEAMAVSVLFAIQQLPRLLANVSTLINDVYSLVFPPQNALVPTDLDIFVASHLPPLRAAAASVFEQLLGWPGGGVMVTLARTAQSALASSLDGAVAAMSTANNRRIEHAKVGVKNSREGVTEVARRAKRRQIAEQALSQASTAAGGLSWRRCTAGTQPLPQSMFVELEKLAAQQRKTGKDLKKLESAKPDDDEYKSVRERLVERAAADARKATETEATETKRSVWHGTQGAKAEELHTKLERLEQLRPDQAEYGTVQSFIEAQVAEENAAIDVAKGREEKARTEQDLSRKAELVLAAQREAQAKRESKRMYETLLQLSAEDADYKSTRKELSRRANTKAKSAAKNEKKAKDAAQKATAQREAAERILSSPDEASREEIAAQLALYRGQLDEVVRQQAAIHQALRAAGFVELHNDAFSALLRWDRTRFTQADLAACGMVGLHTSHYIQCTPALEQEHGQGGQGERASEGGDPFFLQPVDAVTQVMETIALGKSARRDVESHQGSRRGIAPKEAELERSALAHLEQEEEIALHDLKLLLGLEAFGRVTCAARCVQRWARRRRSTAKPPHQKATRPHGQVNEREARATLLTLLGYAARRRGDKLSPALLQSQHAAAARLQSSARKKRARKPPIPFMARLPESFRSDIRSHLDEARRAMEKVQPTKDSPAYTAFGRSAVQGVRGSGRLAIRRYAADQWLSVLFKGEWLDAQVVSDNAASFGGSADEHWLRLVRGDTADASRTGEVAIWLNPWTHVPRELPHAAFEALRGWWAARLEEQHAFIADTLTGQKLEALKQCVAIDVIGEAAGQNVSIHDVHGLCAWVRKRHAEVLVPPGARGAVMTRCLAALLTAPPAAGKTTMISQAVLLTLREQHGVLIPIVLKVQKLQQRLLRNPDVFADALNWVDAFLRLEHQAERPEVYRMLRQVLMARRALVLLDGLDEGGTSRKEIERHVAEVLAPQGHVILATSRPAGISAAAFPGFQMLELAPLTMVQQEQALRQRLGDQKTDQLLPYMKERIPHDINTGLRATSNPLMLSMVASVFELRQGVDMPETIADLYRVASDTMLARIDAEGDHTRVSDCMRALLQRVFFEAHVSQQRIIEDWQIDEAALGLEAPNALAAIRARAMASDFDFQSNIFHTPLQLGHYVELSSRRRGVITRFRDGYDGSRQPAARDVQVTFDDTVGDVRVSEWVTEPFQSSGLSQTAFLVKQMARCADDVKMECEEHLTMPMKAALVACRKRVERDQLPLLSLLTAVPLKLQSSHLSFQEYFAAKALCEEGAHLAGSPPWQWPAWWTNTLIIGAGLGMPFRRGLLRNAGVHGEELDLTRAIGGGTISMALRADRVTSLRAVCEIMGAGLRTLRLETNALSVTDGKLLFEAVQMHGASCVPELLLANNQLCANVALDVQLGVQLLSANAANDTSAIAVLAAALTSNCALTRLDLSNNRLRVDGGRVLATALPSNVSLRFLGLRSNELGAEGGHAVAEALTQNATLAKLDLCDNRLGNAAMQAVDSLLLKTRPTLEVVLRM